MNARCLYLPLALVAVSGCSPDEEAAEDLPPAFASDSLIPASPAVVEIGTVREVPSASQQDSTAEQSLPERDPGLTQPSIQAEGNLEGRFFVSGEIGEEGDLVPGNSHMYIWLEGASARAMYEQIPSVPTREECETGHAFRKDIGRMHCSVNIDSTEHKCYFAIDVPEQKIDTGAIC